MSLTELPESGDLRTWQTWGTYVRLATEPTSVLDQAQEIAIAVLDEVDRACSRFRSDSELVRANAQAGRPTLISPILAAALRVALEAAAETNGLVDPTLGHSLVAVGYDRDLALLPAASANPAAVPRPARVNAWQEVNLAPGEADPESAVLHLPPDCALDLGATGKAWASDLVVRCIADATGADVILSLGGDVCAVGQTPWTVEITELLGDSTEPEPTQLTVGGIATSTTTGRRWVRGGVRRHHLLDPRTGEPTAGPWRTVTAYGHTAAAANTASTAAIVLGDGAWDWLIERSVAARLVGQDGEVHYTPRWPDRSRPEAE